MRRTASRTATATTRIFPGTTASKARAADARLTARRAARRARAAADAVCLARHHHADGRRRVRADPEAATTTPMRRTTRSPGSTGRRATSSSEEFAAALAAMRKAVPVLARHRLPDRRAAAGRGFPDVAWLGEAGNAALGTPMGGAGAAPPDDGAGQGRRGKRQVRRADQWRPARTVFALPVRAGFHWRALIPEAACRRPWPMMVAGRTVGFAIERQGVSEEPATEEADQ